VLVVKLAHMGVIYSMRFLLNHMLARLINNFPSVFRIGGNKLFGETWRRLGSEIKCLLQQQGVRIRAVSVAVSTYSR